MNPQNIVEQNKSDFDLFVDIQTGKYLQIVNRNELKNKNEAEMVIGKIIQAWNEKIVPEVDKLDSFDQSGKIMWFNSFEIDFPVLPGLENKSGINIKNKSTTSTLYPDLDKMREYFDEIFPFLPEGGAFYLIFAGPALDAFGLPIKRYEKLVLGETPTQIEIDILIWACDLAILMFSAFNQKKKSKKEADLHAAFNKAMEYLDDKISGEVIMAIYAQFEDFNSEVQTHSLPPKKNKSKKN